MYQTMTQTSNGLQMKPTNLIPQLIGIFICCLVPTVQAQNYPPTSEVHVPIATPSGQPYATYPAAPTSSPQPVVVQPSQVAVMPQAVVVPPGVVYVAPTYPAPQVGFVWAYHPRFGWGWRHPAHGWHRGWR